ncbi:regulator of sigma E protease [Trypanosoma cruzi]|nr:regulator of sigma E protease [Trypanosoma cruzi]
MNVCFAEHLGIFTHFRCGALPLQQRTARIPSPAHRLRHLPPHPHAAQVSRCSQRQLRAAAGTTNRCHPLIPRVALRPVRLQRPPVPIAILQLHAINVVAVAGLLAAIAAVVESTTADSALPHTPTTFLTVLRFAMCGQVNPIAWTNRCAAMRVARRP